MKIICIGDSNTWGYDPCSFWGEQYEDTWCSLLGKRTGWQVENRGENGKTIPGRNEHLPTDCDAIILMLGTNDLLEGASPEETARRMEGFLRGQPLDKLLLIAPPPMKRGEWVPDSALVEASAALAEQYRLLAHRLGITFADAGQWRIGLAYDGVHLTGEGHRRFAENLESYLKSSGFFRMQPEVDMIPCISVENMRRSDAMTIEKKVPSLTLMHRAAMGVFLAAPWNGRVAIVAGSGNNGGDGYALACILNEHSIPCTVFSLGSRLSADSAFYAEKAEKAGIPMQPFAVGCLSGFDMVVDCLLGTGFQGHLRENYRIAIEEINAQKAFVISVDINSGMNGDTGAAQTAVASDLTVTIGYVKTGLVTENAGKYMKRLVCVDIGILLAEEEGHITHETCPPWLDMEILTVP